MIDGTGNYEAYTFYNWAGIDIFCYFSHHLITIPPLGWINVGHAHGVKVIGTVITEWADGITFWDQVLASELEYHNLASALVAIAKTLKFDGWLLNVENKIAKPDVLLDFVRHFHRLLHQELPHAVLVWYDSVTIQGNLNWQNGLNERNKAFFDVCDGFFTNYSWTVSDVVSSAEAAEERVTDLFIGIDVWGRNFYGGGQFNTQEAIRVAHQVGCSLAIFAPAWTTEAQTTDKADYNFVIMAENLDNFGQALLRDRALWDSIWPFLNTRVPCQMPFQTSFCRGMGKKRRFYGETLSPTPWYNLRHQQYQPNAAHGPHGYLLSTVDKISKHKHGSTHKSEKRGIIRVRHDFQSTRQELLATTHREDSNVSESDVFDEEDDTTDYKSDDFDVEPRTAVKKSRMREALLNLFRPKPAKPAEEEPHKEIKFVENVDVQSETVSNPENVDEVDRKPLESGRERRLEIKYDTLDNEDSLAGPSISSSGPGFNRSMQQMSMNLHLGNTAEKTRYCLTRVPQERECLELYLEDSFMGGGCLKINPSDKISSEHRYTRLFFCDFKCEDTLVFCVVTKVLPQYMDQSLNVSLFMRNAQDESLTVVLTGRNVAHTAKLDASSSGVKYVYPLNMSSEDVFQELRTHLLLHEPGFYVPVENAYYWVVRYYEVRVPGSRLTSVNLRTGLPQGGILLGHFGICHRFKTPEPAPAVS
ncbi:unnamed protein product [Chrysodeixis includens]|nr:unnamed protein product [Chrysodeixis includens]